MPAHDDLAEVTRKVRAWMDVLNAKDIAAIAAWCEDDVEIRIPPARAVTGSRRAAGLFRLIFARYAALEWTLRAIYPISATSAVYETASRGAFADGRSYENEILTLLQFGPTGRVRMLSDYFKDTAIFARPAGTSW